MALKYPVRKYAIFPIALSLVLMLIIPAISAGAPYDNQRMHALVTVPDFNVTNNSLTNNTIPERFLKGPEPVKVQVELDETLSSAPKGEMAIGPRTIGFSTNPAYVVVLIIAVCVIGAGAWQVMRKKQD
jgi:hypothetical protein